MFCCFSPYLYQRYKNLILSLCQGEVLDPDVLAGLNNAPLVTITEEDLEMDATDEASGLDSFLDDDFISKGGGVMPSTEEDDWRYMVSSISSLCEYYIEDLFPS